MQALVRGSADSVIAVQGASTERDEDRAVAELRDQIFHPSAKYVLVFASSRYDLTRLGTALTRAFDIPVYGCTGAGLLGVRGMQRGGIVGASLGGAGVNIEAHLITPLEHAQELVHDRMELLHEQAERLGRDTNAAGILLTDGLSRAEERLTSALYQSLGNTPIVGGSAGDDLRFEKTSICYEGRFLSNAAIFMLFSSRARLMTFKAQHHRATAERVTVTASDPEERVLRELQGEPAVAVYADMVGLPISGLTPNVFSRNPLMLRIGDEYFVRAVQKVNSDGSLTMYCAVETGLVLAIGEPDDPIQDLERTFTALSAEFGEPSIVLGFDCVLRRLYFEQERLDRRVGELLRTRKVLGFNSYGEQCNAVHVNQTFTALAVGR